MRRKRWIRAFVLTTAAALPVVQMLAHPPVALGVDDAGNIDNLVAAISNPATPVPQRNEAATRLVNANSKDARAAAKALLSDSGKPLAQAAVADAVAQTGNPDKELISVFAQLLGSTKLLSAAAASALANYGANPDAFNRLTSFIDITKNSNAVRSDAIKAMGNYANRSAAEYLIRLLGAPNQSQPIIDATTSALGDLAGITTFGSDVTKWQHWWDSVQNKTTDQFAAMLLETRALQSERLKQRDAQLVRASNKFLDAYYYAAPDAHANPGDTQKSDVLLQYLTSEAPDIRKEGVNLAVNDFIKHRPIDAVRKQLFALISDVDEEVRLVDIKFLLTLKDHDAFNLLLDQLKVETNAKIKIQIVAALGELDDVAAVSAFLELLRDPNIDVKTAAARELAGNLGAKLRQTNSKNADDASSQIRDLLAANEGVPGSERLRAACLSALAVLRDKASFDTFNKYLQPGQPSEIRRAALLGLGNLANTNADQMVAIQLRDNDKTVRLAAATALQTVATPGQADQIFNLMNSDPDEDVRQALWLAFQNLYSKESTDDLEHWQAQFDNDPPKKLATLLKLNDALVKAGDKQQVALNQQNLAAAYMAVTPPRPTEAIQNLQAALDYLRSTGGNDLHLAPLVEQLMDAQLQDGRYEDAVVFAQKQIALTPEFGGTLGLKISQKADELLRDNNLTASQALVTEALKMSPPLEDKYLHKIRDIQSDLKQRGAAPAGP